MAAVVTMEEQPISRTYQYRKVMKPMLERKRRARINRCLDELKELLVGALQAEGESVSRLEKADVLELTVRHLHKLRRSQQLSENSANERFRAGFSHCATEVSKYITTLPPTMDINVSSRLLSHLENSIHQLESEATPVTLPRHSPINIINNYTPPSSPGASSPSHQHHHQHHHHHPSPAHLQSSQSPFHTQHFQRPITGHLIYRPLTHPHLHHSTEEPFDLSNASVWRPW